MSSSQKKENKKEQKGEEKKQAKTLASVEEIQQAIAIQEERMLLNLPPQAQERFKEIKAKVTKLSDLVREKFGEYVNAVAILPPDQKKDENGNISVNQQKINVLVLIDDADSQRFPREDLQAKFNDVVTELAKKVDPDLAPNCVMLSLLWQSCLDTKWEIVESIAMSSPIYDTGVLSALKVTETHKRMVLQKFEKYIVSYVLAGSLIRGQATPTSDIDVFVVIDDTDVKKMTRYELRERLRGIILQMGTEAGEMLGIRNKLNIQVYILSDFWDSLREANPIIYTLLRDGVPLFDRGMFMPWKQLLRMGKIRPSKEAIDLFMSSGQEAIRRTHMKLREIGIEDLYYAMLTPTQAALMLYGVAPPAPRETPQLLREIFVQKEKLLDEKHAKMLEDTIRIRKELEHGSKKEITGKEIDDLLKNAEEYLKKIETVFEKMDKRKESEDVGGIHELVISVTKEALQLLDVKVDEAKLQKQAEEHLVETNFLSKSSLRTLSAVLESKKDHEKGNLAKEELAKLQKEARILVKELQEFIARKRGRDIQRARIRVKHGDSFGELILLEEKAFIIDNVEREKATIRKAAVNKDGSLGTLQPSSFEELENILTTEKIPAKVFVRQPLFKDLQKAFGRDVEIILR